MTRGKLSALALALLLCSGCDARDGMIPPEATDTALPEETGGGLARGVEDMLDGVERTARDLGRRAEESLQ